MSSILFSFPKNEKLAESLSQKLRFDLGEIILRHFPDGESYVKINSPVSNRKVIFVCTLHPSDENFLSLFFAAKTAKELGATQVGLITPYLAYMRQDHRFNPGEAVNARHFASLLSQTFDWLITVDPHLHRIHSLDEIYSIPTSVAHAAPLLAEWIQKNIQNPLLIGPDAESEQWVSEVAKGANAPFVVLQKKRLGDRQVEILFPEIFESYRERTPVLIDDVISTGQTMIQAVQKLKKINQNIPVCLGVHAIFSGNAYQDLLKTGAQVITCNTIAHPSSKIDVSLLIADKLQNL